MPEWRALEGPERIAGGERSEPPDESPTNQRAPEGRQGENVRMSFVSTSVSESQRPLGKGRLSVLWASVQGGPISAQIA
jgi:hypothetical protein